MWKRKKRSQLQGRLRTIQNVADECQVSTKTVRRWIDDGELAAYKLGRQWRISELDLKHFLRERWNG
jgi:excisionase family DNA binding protein